MDGGRAAGVGFLLVAVVAVLVAVVAACQSPVVGSLPASPASLATASLPASSGGPPGSPSRPPLASAAAEAGSWTTTGSMASFRTFGGMAVLADGTVLAPDGAFATSDSDQGVVASSERFDPATGIWTSTDSMRDPRGGSLVLRLSDGRVLVVGGVGRAASDAATYGVTASAEIFDPATGHWAAAGSMSTPRSSYAGAVLMDGRVLVVGGLTTLGNSLETTPSADLFDPKTGRWTATEPMRMARVFHSATVLADGRVLVAGGTSKMSNLTFLATTEIYDPVKGSWTPTGDLVDAPQFHAATRLHDGRVLLVGVAGPGLDRAITAIYDLASGTWAAAAETSAPRDHATETLLLDGRVLVAGGGRPLSGPSLASAELFDPVSGTWARAAEMSVGRSQAAASLLPDGHVLIAGGRADGRMMLTSAELFSP